MEDPELSAIRAKRMAEMQGGGGGGGGGGGSPGGMAAGMAGGFGQGGDPGKEQEQAKAAEEMRKSMLMGVLSSEAAARLGRLAMVKPQKARQVEEYLLNMARSGRLQGKVTEQALIELLESANDESRKETKITMARRRYDDSDDDEDYGF